MHMLLFISESDFFFLSRNASKYMLAICDVCNLRHKRTPFSRILITACSRTAYTKLFYVESYGSTFLFPISEPISELKSEFYDP